MKEYNLIIGSYVVMNKNNKYLLGALNETINNGANAMMIYTGPPQNTIRVSTDKFFIDEFHSRLKKYNIQVKNVIVHAPYIINLANTFKKNIFDIAIKCLQKEIMIADEIKIQTIVLHPGSAVGASEKEGLDKIIEGLNLVLTINQKTKIALETMSGKGTELGSTFEQLKYIIDNVKLKDKLGVCWDICHLHDAGYNFNNNLEDMINKFDRLIGLDKLLCLHINDSKNPINSHKDRHENIGYGYIGFGNLLKIIYHPKFNNKIKILETPYLNKDKNNKAVFSPYKEEIKMIKNKFFTDPFKKY